jgi:hypothetical protein
LERPERANTGFFSRVGRRSSIPLPRPNIPTKPITRRIRQANVIRIIGAIRKIGPIEIYDSRVPSDKKRHITPTLISFAHRSRGVPESYIRIFPVSIAIYGKYSGPPTAIQHRQGHIQAAHHRQKRIGHRLIPPPQTPLQLNRIIS